MKHSTHKCLTYLPRRLTAIMMGFSLAALGCYGSAPEETPRPFELTAVAVEAIEGGPCVIDVKQLYHGTQSFRHWYHYGPDVVPPDNWVTPRPHADELKFTFAPGVTMEPIYRLKPGVCVQERCYVHRYDSTRILPGKARLCISWPIIQIKDEQTKLPASRGLTPPDADEERRYTLAALNLSGGELIGQTDEIGNPPIYLDIDVLPASPKNLSALRERLKQRLKPEASAEEIEDVAKHLYNTRHPPLSSITWRIIEGRYWSDINYLCLFRVIDESTNNWSESEARFIRLAHNSRCGARGLLFKYLAERKPAISRNAFTSLTNSDSIWVRVLTYLWFSKQCDPLWVTDLLATLPELTQPFPQPEFAHLLQDLDGDAFAMREKATARLTALGERVEVQLKDAVKGPLSPEAKRRVRLVLERIAAEKASPEWKPILEDLHRQDTPAAQAILHALANGAPEAELTKAAAASRRASP